MRTLIGLFLAGIGLSANADLRYHHVYPNITGFSNPIIQYTRYPNASLGLKKAQASDGSDYKPRVDVREISFGMMRERYDNNFSAVSIFLAQSASGEPSDQSNRSAALDGYYGLSYATGAHEGLIDWSFSFDIGSGSATIDGDTEDSIGVGIGFDAAAALHKAFDVGVSIQVSRHYEGAGLFIKGNF